jgi:small subunit ribosomal protein S6
LASNVYEGMFIFDSSRYGRDPEAVSGQVQEVIEKAGGEMLVHRLWDERRLAYAIKGQRKGTYWLTYFRLDSNQLSTVRRQYQLNENILRMLFLKVEPRIVDALVAHARTASFVAPSEAPKEAAAGPVGEKAVGVLDEVAEDVIDVVVPDEEEV